MFAVVGFLYAGVNINLSWSWHIVLTVHSNWIFSHPDCVLLSTFALSQATLTASLCFGHSKCLLVQCVHCCVPVCVWKLRYPGFFYDVFVISSTLIRLIFMCLCVCMCVFARLLEKRPMSNDLCTARFAYVSSDVCVLLQPHSLIIIYRSAWCSAILSHSGCASHAESYSTLCHISHIKSETQCSDECHRLVTEQY